MSSIAPTSEAGSTFSQTDLFIFKNLANPEAADVQRISATAPLRAQGGPSSAAAQALESAVNAASHGKRSSRDNEDGDSDNHETKSKRHRSERHGRSDADRKRSSTMRKRSASPLPRSRADSSPRSPKKDDQQLEKQNCLLELQHLESKGIQLSRKFTMEDSLSELEFELSRQNSLVSIASSVTFLKDALKLGISGVEILNSRCGPFLRLDGWAASVCGDMEKYDNALEKLAKQHFRRNTMSPIVELGFMLIGSLVMWHFRAALFGGGTDTFLGPTRVPAPPTAPETKATPNSQGSTSPPTAPTPFPGIQPRRGIRKPFG